ncbi:hypothetical protein HIM_00856 [Hirsutella minnesotensis 3608]|nr:hypothetical protein HIM_00856 [Hirsutella minnesotensis 3608]
MSFSDLSLSSDSDDESFCTAPEFHESIHIPQTEDSGEVPLEELLREAPRLEMEHAENSQMVVWSEPANDDSETSPRAAIVEAIDISESIRERVREYLPGMARLYLGTKRMIERANAAPESPSTAAAEALLLAFECAFISFENATTWINDFIQAIDEVVPVQGPDDMDRPLPEPPVILEVDSPEAGHRPLPEPPRPLPEPPRAAEESTVRGNDAAPAPTGLVRDMDSVSEAESDSTWLIDMDVWMEDVQDELANNADIAETTALAATSVGSLSSSFPSGFHSSADPYLDYHAEIRGVSWPQIFRLQPESPSDLLNQEGSRRVVFDGLPRDVTVSQILSTVKCFGGVTSASIEYDRRPQVQPTKSAVVEFTYAKSAAEWVEFVQSKTLVFSNRDEDPYTARIWLVPTPSFQRSAQDHKMLLRNCTRALQLLLFPIDCVWDLLSTIGTRCMVNVQYCEGPRTLTIEFTSLFEANRALRVMNNFLPHLQLPLQDQRVLFVPDSSHGNPEDFFTETRGWVEWVSPARWNNQFDRPPYNQYRSEENFIPPPAITRLDRNWLNEILGGKPRPVTPDPKPTWAETLANQYDVSPSQLSETISERRDFQDVQYRIVGSNITLTRRAWSWRVEGDGDIKLLMANTLHEPAWEADWDEYFARTGGINFRTWERYGFIARHRRVKATEQGLEPSQVPMCGKSCEWKCGRMAEVSMPLVVLEWLKRKPSKDDPIPDEQ